MELHIAPFVVPVLGTLIPRRRNPVIIAKTDERIAFEVSVERQTTEITFNFENVPKPKFLKMFLEEFLRGLGEKGLKVTVNVRGTFESFKISTYAILTAHLMVIIGNKLGYDVSIDDIEKYSPLLESKELISYLPIIMALRVSTLKNKSMIYRFREGWIELPSKNKFKGYMLNIPNKVVTTRTNIGNIDLLAHIGGRNIIDATQMLRVKSILESYIITEESLQYAIYNLEDIVDLNMYFKCKCIIFPDIESSSLICFKKPHGRCEEIIVTLGEKK